MYGSETRFGIPLPMSPSPGNPLKSVFAITVTNGFLFSNSLGDGLW